MSLDNYHVCKKCKKKYHIKAAKECPFCKKQKEKKEEKELGILIFKTIILAAAAIFMIHSFFYSENQSTSYQAKRTTQPEPKRVRESTLTSQAAFICQNLAEVQLKSPGSAEHPYGISAKKNKAGNYVSVTYVDSQNSFGAMLRTYYVCELNYKGGDPYNYQSWKPVNFFFQ
jgi:hypothetical protein